MYILFDTTIAVDGFGYQFMYIIFTLAYCEYHGYEYIHRPITRMEHNYNNDNNFFDKIEELINIKNNYKSICDFTIYQLNPRRNRNIKLVNRKTFIDLFFKQGEITKYLNKNTYFKYKDIFWKNKDRSKIYTNNKFNVAIHIRRNNKVDTTKLDRLLISNQFYLDKINMIKEIYKDKDLHFNIISQGSISNFECFISDNITLHLDTDLSHSFILMVESDLLITAPSSLSYVAALLSDKEIYYYKYFSKHDYSPLDHWKILPGT